MLIREKKEMQKTRIWALRLFLNFRLSIVAQECGQSVSSIEHRIASEKGAAVTKIIYMLCLFFVTITKLDKLYRKSKRMVSI